MSFLFALGLYLFGFFLFTYTCIIADASTSLAAKLVTVTLPQFCVIRPLKAFFGDQALDRALDVLSSWFLVLVYQVLVFGSWSVVFAYVFPEISISTTVSSWPHKFNGCVIFLACIESWRRAHETSPGYITSRTISKYDNYPFDNILYFPNQTCPTVGIFKLARSKYDRYKQNDHTVQATKGRHVPRFDHYCGWIHNNVGEENYRYFLLFLCVHFLMCLYGSIILYKLLSGIVTRLGLFHATFINVVTGEEISNVDLLLIGQFLTMHYFPIVSLGILLLGMTIVLGFFLAFHVYITTRGMTTNEFFKWRVVRRAYWSQPETERPQNFPENLYDHGMLENWKEVLWPRSLRFHVQSSKEK